MITSPDGTVMQKIAPPPLRHVNLEPAYLETVRAGLRAAAAQPGGTSDDVFGNFAEQIYDTAGTAQYTGQTDNAWYAGYVPASATTKPIAVVVWFQQGAFGTVSAAPVARQILSQWFTGKKGPWKPETSTSL
jgi:penicillin-binding protein 2